MLLQNLSAEEMKLKSRARGRTIAEIFKHMIKNKFDWMEHLRPKLNKKVPNQDKIDLQMLEEYASSWVVEYLELEVNGQPVKGFKSDIFGFVIYLISHDSHHRGQILQILRDNGIKLPTNVQYGVWEWD